MELLDRATRLVLPDDTYAARRPGLSKWLVVLCGGSQGCGSNHGEADETLHNGGDGRQEKVSFKDERVQPLRRTHKLRHRSHKAPPTESCSVYVGPGRTLACCHLWSGFQCDAQQPDQQFPFLPPAASHSTTQPPLQVVIIGGGPAGTSAGFFLSQFANASGTNITFRRGTYPAPASLSPPTSISTSPPANSISLLGSLPPGSDAAQLRGMGREFAFKSSDSSWWDTIKLFWRYEKAPLQIRSLRKCTVDQFQLIYILSTTKPLSRCSPPSLHVTFIVTNADAPSGELFNHLLDYDEECA
ncbi:hypothetical protein PCASD_00805 [Puccinia coronata f. sp. avenae]|uniref:Uncharacterized protein n=1 Tax=Puccinia coronata f. sp. avenae TaxID=200324 RepID=A0A2N5S0W2_9BASI|nr:hypothetical protein PCASD_26306 [Puccinia coronata f. sp. avenae]PLW51873.1 hypothetical protein PCASD_00805 [Puccinia coronata f. sp. avenae]